MRQPPSKIIVKKEIERTTITSFKNNQVKPTDSDDKTIQKSNILVKILGLETYVDPVPGQFQFDLQDLILFQRHIGLMKFQNEFFQLHF